MNPGRRHWLFALLLAGLLHGALAAAWFGKPDDDGAQDAGIGGIQVSVGLAGSYEPAPQPIVETEPEEPVVEQPPVEPEPVEPEVVAEPPAEPEPVPEVTQEPEPVEQPVDKPQKAVKRKKVETPKKVVKRKAPPTAKPARQAPAPPSKEQTVAKKATERRPTNQATGVGQRIETGGNPAARQGYYAQVMAQIARHKRYPRSARREGVTGVATVTFVIAADGSLQSQLLKRSSGDQRLDQEALEMLKRASPFPPIPKDIGDGPLKLTLPIEFSLHR